jgi:hypothetical protein
LDPDIKSLRVVSTYLESFVINTYWNLEEFTEPKRSIPSLKNKILYPHLVPSDLGGSELMSTFFLTSSFFSLLVIYLTHSKRI